MRIAVTGSAGFIGSALCYRLTRDGHRCVRVDRRAADPDARIDITVDEHRLRDALRHCDVVIHLAGLAGVRPSFKRIVDYNLHNVVGTAAVVEACSRVGVARLVVASSSSVYGHCEGPADEERALNPLSPYAATKAAAERLVIAASQGTGMQICILRPFTVFGPGQRQDMAIAQFIAAMTQGKAVRVWPFIRDFTYIDDVVDAFVRAATYFYDARILTINVGAGAPVSAQDLLRELSMLLNYQRPVEVVGGVPKGEPGYTHASTDKAQQILGWQPYAGLAEGLVAQVSATQVK